MKIFGTCNSDKNQWNINIDWVLWDVGELFNRALGRA